MGIEYYQTAVALAPKNGPLRHGLVMALCHFDVLDKALAECKKGSDADPSDPWPPYSRGVVLTLHNRHQEASDSFRKACQLNPTWALAHQKLAMSLESCGRPEDARAVLRELAALEKSENNGLDAARDEPALRKLPMAEKQDSPPPWTAVKPRPLEASVLTQARVQVDKAAEAAIPAKRHDNHLDIGADRLRSIRVFEFSPSFGGRRCTLLQQRIQAHRPGAVRKDE